MRCKTCDYPLWNLKTRQCPECGSPFAPDEFDFRPSTVRFCCPHCNQVYFGTDGRGHLVPRQFDCVTCGRALTMNDMVLRPAEGLEEIQTKAAVNRWLERGRAGWLKSWFAAVGQSLTSPQQLMKGTTVESSMKHAWWFLIVTVIAVLLVSFIPAICMMAGLPFVFSATGGAPPGGPSAGVLAAFMSGATIVSFLFVIPLILLFVLVWGLATHGFLRLGPSGHETIRRTFQALCYSSGAYVTSVVPCLGGYVGPIWWLVSAVLMVRAGHHVSGVRATFAVITLPVALTILFVAGYVAIIVAAVVSSGTVVPGGLTATPVQKTQIVLGALLDHADGAQGSWPGHALALAEQGYMTEWDYVGQNTVTEMNDVPAGGGLSLLRFVVLPEADRAELVEDAAAALPAGVTAHRLGDFVFTYHGVDRATAPGGLWLVVMTPDPDAAGGAPVAGPVEVGLADGTTRTITQDRLAEVLARQNELRAKEGLPPLPDLTRVTHDAPAKAVP